ncbi:MAG: Indolepyruvate ferredoxin oxidoreductase [Firmicutes bacterium]|nr:Indolepyruvate ferredoxin oxidoreductase [Bacillota bacterium]
MSEVKNILLVGVGGQGTILASKILSTGLVEAGYDVKMSEVHGMAQRGGSVTTQVRYGEKVFSPIIDKGQADILVAFETMEALRWLDYLKPDGNVIINDYQIPSAPILIGKQDYPEGVLETIKSKVGTTVIKASEIAKDLGNVKAMNVVLFGAMVKAMKLTNISWEEIIADNVKTKFIELNVKAFKAGITADIK